jgi:hypothetical protein
MTSYLFALVDGGGTVPPELGAARAVGRILGDSGYREAAAQLGRVIRADANSGALINELEDSVAKPSNISAGRSTPPQ